LETGGSCLISEEDLDAQLQRSWIENAAAWTGAVRDGRIASRRAGTDAAIVEAVRQFPPCPVLDLGCGEGWLVRALSAEDYAVTGIDASRSLIDEASKSGGGAFFQMSYEDLARERSIEGPFGLVVANYSLLGRDIHALLEKVNSLLVKDGALIIQTLHPLSQDPDARDEAGWRTEAFTDMGDGFSAGMPYYFRTFSRWVEDLTAANFAIVHCREPLHPETGRPLSLLIVARPSV
jgi:cyclopropane fatty-acyl-phospholipid synthase-like methyltransferase